MKKEVKKMTLEGLAAIVTKGFERMASKDDLNGVKTDLMKRMASKADLEDLAAMTARGFQEVSGRFDRVENEVMEVKKEVVEVKRAVIGLDHKVEGLELRISSYASAWTKDFDRLHEWMEELDSRVNKIEDKIVSVK